MNSLLKQRGFSLVEISIVTLIIGLLVAGSMTMFKAQKESAMYQESTNRIQQVKDVMLSFVVINNYMLCPDTNTKGTAGYGRENRTNGRCSGISGGVPFLDLGLNESDVFDGKYNLIRYFINQNANTLVNIQSLADSASYFCNGACDAQGTVPLGLPIFTTQTPPIAGALGAGNYDICARTSTSCTAASEMEYEDLPIILVADNLKGVGNCNAQSTAEQENCDNDNLFWQGNFNLANGRAFDDFVVGISAYEIKSKMLLNDPKSLN